MTQKTVHVVVLRDGKLAGKAAEDVQARIKASTAALAGELEQLKQDVAQASSPASDSGSSMTPNGNGTITIRTP